MSNVYDIMARIEEVSGKVQGPKGPPVDPPGGGGDDGGMEERSKRVEALAEKTDGRLTGVEMRLTKLETKAETFATKADVADAKNSIIMWVVSAVLLAQLLPALLKVLGP